MKRQTKKKIKSSKKTARKQLPIRRTTKKNKSYKSFKFNRIEKNKEFIFPAAYGKDRLVLLVKDPWWIYAYWEVTPQNERQVLEKMAAQKAGKGQRVLRVHQKTGRRNFFDIEAGLFSDNWFIDVGAPDQEWAAEIGVRSSDGRFFPLIRSNTVRTPRYGVSEEIDPDWTMPDALWKKLLETSGLFEDSKSSFELSPDPS